MSYFLDYSQNVTAGNLLVVVVDGYQIPSSVSISDSQGNTYQAADSLYTGPSVVWSQVFWATAKSSGANRVTADFHGSSIYPGMALYEVASSTGGTWSVAGKQGTTNGGGAGTLTVGSVTTSSASSFILAYITSANGTVMGGTGWTFTPGVSYVLGSIEAGVEYQIGPANTYTGTFVDTAGNGFAGGVVAFQATASGLSPIQSITNAPRASQTSYSLAYSQNVTAGNILVVVMEGVQFIPSSVSISDSQGNNYQAADNMYTDTTWNGWSQAFWTTARSSGANTVTATFSSATYPGMALYEVTSSSSGTWSVAGKQGINSGTGTGTLKVGSVTTSSTSSFIVSYIISANGDVAGGTGWTYTPGVNYVLGSIEAGTEYQIGPAGTYTGTFIDNTANGFAGGVVAFQVTGTTAGNVPQLIDFARCLAYWTTTTNCGTHGSDPIGSYTQAQAEVWLAGKVAITEDIQATRSGIHAANPAVKFWYYVLDFSCRQGNAAANSGCDNAAGWVEDDFLHTAFPHTTGNRLTATVFNQARYFFNLHSSTTRTKIANYFTALVVSAGDQYVWADEHGSWLSDHGIGNTNVDEYGGPADAHLDDYETDIVAYVGTMVATAATNGLGYIANLGNDATQTSNPNISSELTSNPGEGWVTEGVWRPDSMSNTGGLGFWVVLPLIKKITDGHGIVDLLYRADLNNFGALQGNLTTGPSNYVTSNPNPALERATMWTLAAYYLVQSPYTYFDLNIDWGRGDPIVNQYWPMFDYGGLGPATAAINGTPTDYGVNACAGGNQEIYVWDRPFANGHVYVRPYDGSNCTAGNDGPTVITITLPQPMKILKGDGTLSAPMTTINLKMEEAAIMVIQ